MNLVLILSLLICVLCRWTPQEAKEWYDRQPWLVGTNFIPSTAANELEMWQADTFDLLTIDRELGWAQELGFNTARVFLHYLLWESDKEGFFDRMDKYLTVSTRHNINTAFVLLDDCWCPHPVIGKQPDPIPHLHNSRWVKSPGVEISQNLEKQKLLEGYIKDTLKRFGNDKRVVMWDLYNEPGNGNLDIYAVPMLKRAFAWAREANPSQPIIAALWDGVWNNPEELLPLNKVMLDESDLLVFHNYENLEGFKEVYNYSLQYKRPLICNEWMSRSSGSTFKDILPFMKEKKIGAYSWGFVSGKTQTIYPWDSWFRTYTEEPKVWFHDILRQDGTPFDEAEIDAIKSVTLS